MTLSMDDTPFLFVSFLLDLVPNTHRFGATVDAGTGHPWGTSFMMVALSVFFPCFDSLYNILHSRCNEHVVFMRTKVIKQF